MHCHLHAVAIRKRLRVFVAGTSTRHHSLELGRNSIMTTTDGKIVDLHEGYHVIAEVATSCPSPGLCAGSLNFHVHRWCLIRPLQWALRTIHGCSLGLASCPPPYLRVCSDLPPVIGNTGRSSPNYATETGICVANFP